MTEDFVQLKKSDGVLTLKIKKDNGEYTGEELVFDLDDIELPLRYQELVEQDKKNKEWLRNQFLIIEKRQDVKGKKLLTKNQEDKIKAIRDFFEKERKVYDMFLGDGGLDKLLNGKRLGWNTLADIDEVIEKQIVPKINVDFNAITNKIKDRYKQAVEKQEDVLK